MSDLFIARRAPIPHDGSRRIVADGVLNGPLAIVSDFCRCHAEHGLTAPADSLDGICATCRSRSKEACQKAHAKETAA